MSEWTAETADRYAAKYGEYATNRLAVAELELASDATVVDLGCGTGAALRHAALQVTDGTLIGVDPIPRVVEIARERTAADPNASRIEIRSGCAEALPVDDAFADVVLAFDSFDHWNDVQAGFDEVRRILRPAGRFVVVKDGGLPDGSKAKRTLVAALANAGFEVLSERNIEKEGVAFTMWVAARTAT